MMMMTMMMSDNQCTVLVCCTQSMQHVTHTGLPFVPDFPGQSRFCVFFKELCPGAPQNSVRGAKVFGFSQVVSCDTSDSVYKQSDLPTVEEHIYRGRRAASRTQTGRHRREKDVKIGDCRVWTETARGEERICEEKSLTLSVPN
jgi:hypothetical protein